jgi:hypothetical protein
MDVVWPDAYDRRNRPALVEGRQKRKGGRNVKERRKEREGKKEGA